MHAAMRRFRGNQPIADGGFAFPPRGFNQRVERDGDARPDVSVNRLEVNFRTFRREERLENIVHFRVFGELRQHETHKMVTDDEIVHAGDFREVAVSDIPHFADDGKRRFVALGNIAEMQQRDEGARVRFLYIQPVVAQDDDMVVGGRIQRIQKFAAGLVARPKDDFLILKRVGAGAAFAFQIFVRDDRDERAFRDVGIQFADEDARAGIPSDDEGAFRFRRGRRAILQNDGVVYRGRIGRIEADGIVIFRDGENRVALLDGRIHRRVEKNLPVPFANAEDSGGLAGKERVAVGLANQRGRDLRINFIALEIQQFRIHHRKPGLPRSLRHEAGD